MAFFARRTKEQPSTMNLPIELINRILSYRPSHPNAVLIQQKLKIYYEEDFDYYEQFSKQMIHRAFFGHEVTSFRIFVHKIKSFQEWCLHLPKHTLM